MNRTRIFSPAAVVAAAFLSVAPLAAQTVIVTSPGVKTVSVAGPDQNDLFAADTWLRDNMRSGSSAGVSGTYANGTTGSAYLSGTTGASKADMEYYFGGAVVSPFKLGDFNSASYQFYRDASSTTQTNQNPIFRLLVDADGTGAHKGYLIYEGVYNGVTNPATNTWNTNTILPASNFWLREGGQNYYSLDVYNQPLSVFQSVGGFTTNDRATFNANSVVYGINFGIGSGWSGSYTGAVDNVSLHYADANDHVHDVTFNFEASQSTVPEPSSMALLGTGLIGLVPMVRRRRKH